MKKIGLIGAGKIVENFHLPAWQQIEEAEVVAICDPREDVVRRLAKRFSIASFYQSAEAMIQNTTLDAVDICSPHRMHSTHACMALKAGLHCIVEKPFATKTIEAKSIASQATQNNRVIMCGQHQRFRPPSALVKSMIDAGEFGDVYCIRVDAMATRGVPVQVGNSFTDYEQSGGGPLIDQGSHALDVAWWFLGCPKPVSDFCVTSDRTAPRKGKISSGAEWDVYSVEDFATGIIRFENDSSITIHTSYFANCSTDAFQCEVLGSKAGIVWPTLNFTQEYQNDFIRKKLPIDDTQLASVSELQHFMALINGFAVAQIPVEQSITLVSMIESLYLSARLGEAIKM